ncbi:tetratricopeptide repeat protein [Glycomyces tarimensis]
MDSDPTRRTVAEHLERAELMYDLDRLPEAKTEVDAALRLDPLDPDANAMAGVVALAERDPDEALVFAGAALAHEPRHRRAMIVRGYALADAERRDEALQAAASLLELDRASWVHHVHYALITRRAGAGQPALDAAWNAVNLAPEQPRTHLALAAVAESLDMGDLARRSRQAAAELEPDAASPSARFLPPEARRASRSFVDADPADPAWRSKIFGAGLFRGALGRSILLGLAVAFGLPALLGSDIDAGARLFFAIVAAACWVAWFTVLRRHRRAE